MEGKKEREGKGRERERGKFCSSQILKASAVNEQNVKVKSGCGFV